LVQVLPLDKYPSAEFSLSVTSSANLSFVLTMPAVGAESAFDLQPPTALDLEDLVSGFDLDSIASLSLYGMGIGLPVLCICLPLSCWWWRSQTWKMRDCWCFKRCMRCSGMDGFDDFEAIISVHEVQHQNKSNGSTSVRLTAGTFDVETDVSTHSNFQQSFVLSVEQGTDVIEVDLLDSYKRKMATLKLDPVKDLLKNPEGVSQKSFSMKTKQKGVGSTQISLSIRLDQSSEEERGLLKTFEGKPHAVEVEFLLREQLRKVEWNEDQPAEAQLHTLASACTGPVDYFSYFGVATPGVLAMIGPPARRRWTLGFWKDPADFGRAGDVEVDLMRISSVQEDPGRSEVFVVSYLDANRVESRILFRRTDRARDVWVHLLTMLISAVREVAQSQKAENMSMRPSKSAAGGQKSHRDMDRSGSNRDGMMPQGSASRHSNSARPSRSHREKGGDSEVRSRSAMGGESSMRGEKSNRMDRQGSRMEKEHSSRGMGHERSNRGMGEQRSHRR